MRQIRAGIGDAAGLRRTRPCLRGVRAASSAPARWRGTLTAAALLALSLADAAAGTAPGPAAVDAAAPQLVRIGAGQFAMGSPVREHGADPNEVPRHGVRVAAFEMGRTEVTVGQFRRFVQATGYRSEAERGAGGPPGCVVYEAGDWTIRADRDWRSPGFAQTEDHPVVCVSWNDAQAYVRWLAHATGQGWRLPSEAQWEYAARAGTRTRFFWGEDARASDLCLYANVADQAAKDAWHPPWSIANCADGHAYAAPVASARANPWGLHGTSGNVWEWTEDCYNTRYTGAPADGGAWRTGNCEMRPVRGGGWSSLPDFARSACRQTHYAAYRSSDLGFRVARTLP